ncbi:WD40 repeat-like protein [Pluteus cervinus]|uniref:WD40 repeat-like protein n=1 Tax=Pluteus cervinus TaxID=181527 RepID=A0ACD3B1H0_9AGAR|nr:WD40 repeat-like protein [Pluteus cervinus]
MIIWDVIVGQPVGQPLQGHCSIVTSVAYSSDGRYVVSGSWDHTVRIWDASTGQPVGQPLQGHSNIVSSVAYSPDGRHVASGSHDKTVRIWDASTGQPVGQPLQGHSGMVTSVAYSPNGRHVVSGSYDTTVRIWDAGIGQPVDQKQQLQDISFSGSSFILFPTTKHLLPHTCSQDLTTPCIPCSGVFSSNDLSSNAVLASAILQTSASHQWVTFDNKHILWLPFYLCAQLYAPTVAIISHDPLQCKITFDWTKFVHGDEWTSVFTPLVEPLDTTSMSLNQSVMLLK